MKKRLTFTDVAIIAVILLAVAVLGVKIIKDKPEEKITVNFTVMATNLLPETADAIKDCDKVLVDATSDLYGKVLNVRSEATTEYTFDSYNEKYIKKTIEERKDVYADVQVEVSATDYGYMAGERYLRIGEHMYVSGDDYVLAGYIIGFEEQTDRSEI